MARTVSISSLTTRVRQAADAENDQHVTDAEILSLLNVYYPAFFDLLIDCAPPDYFSTVVTFNTVSNQLNYDLSTICPAGDFYKIRHLYAVDSNGRYRSIRPVPESLEAMYKPVTTGGIQMRLIYVPCAPVLVSADIDGINGWEEMLVLKCAIDIKRKKEEDINILSSEVSAIESRMRRMSPRDLAEPERVVRRRYRGFNEFYWENMNVDGYRLRGSNIELWTHTGYYYG